MLPAGYRVDPKFRSLPVDIVFDRDVAVTMRDGTTIYVDIFRPESVQKMPVIVAWSPYGKGQGNSPSVTMLYASLGISSGLMSGLEKFEAADPAYWCAHGYAICNPDPRGIGHSDGDSNMFGTGEARDCHDLIEWLAFQDWCNGKVGMSGTSYLAHAQWFAAAEQPPHLAAINPCEGFSDTYRDLTMRGGMPDLGFARRLLGGFCGKNKREDVVVEAEHFPLYDALWQDKTARFDRVTVPTYVVASYSNTLHTVGTFRGWRQIASDQKWLRIHNTQEWPDYYDQTNVDDLRRFFDRYLKGQANGWEDTPRVRYSVLDLKGGDRVNLPAGQFPPDDVAYARYYLDGTSRALTPEAPSEEVAAAYDSEGEPRLVSFVVRFETDTVMVGYPKVRLWVGAEGSDDMDLFVLVQKLDAHGTHLQQITVPNQGARMLDLTENGSSILRYKGADGRLRVSARRLNQTLSTDTIPVQSFDRVEKLQPGEVAEVEISLSPIGLLFHADEQLRLVIGARNLQGPMMPQLDEYTPANRGQHIIHTGGSRASYLQLPIAGG